MVEARLREFGDKRLVEVGVALLGAMQQRRTLCVDRLAVGYSFRTCATPVAPFGRGLGGGVETTPQPSPPVLPNTPPARPEPHRHQA
jgi:hypothetical protein